MRKSSEDETEKQAESLPRQKRDIEAYLERNQLDSEENILEVLPEDIHKEDASAKKIGRKEFEKVISKIKKRKGYYKALLCTELTRLSRNPIDNGTIISLLDDGYIEQVRTLDQVFRANPTDKFTLSLFLSVAKFENDMRAKNTSSGMQNRKSNGATTNRAPMGYINCGGKKGKKWVEGDGDNFEKFKKLWELFGTGNYSVADIIREGEQMGVTLLNSDGSRTFPSDTTFHSMFRNRYYVGEVPLKDENTGINKWVKGEHPPMANVDLFDKVQLLLQKGGYKHQKVNRNLPYEVILQNVLICGKTNKAMSFERKIRYTCGNCKGRFAGNRLEGLPEIKCPDCGHILSQKEINNREYRKFYSAPPEGKHTFIVDGVEKKALRSIDTKYIENEIDKELTKITISDGLYEVLKKRLYTLWLEKRSDLDKQIKTLNKEIDTLNKDRRASEDRITKEIETLSEERRIDIEDTIKENRELIENKEIEIKELRDKLNEEFERAWQILYTLFDAKNIFSNSENGDFEPKRKLLLSIVSNIIFLDGKIIMKWSSPFDIIATGNLTKQKSYSTCRISEKNVTWLPELDSNQGPTG